MKKTDKTTEGLDRKFFEGGIYFPDLLVKEGQQERDDLAKMVRPGPVQTGPPGKDRAIELFKSDAEFFQVAIRCGVGSHIGWDWHEPDQIEIDAVVDGRDFDNAGIAGEKMVHLKVDGRRIAAVNLATLCALATAAVMRLQAPEADK